MVIILATVSVKNHFTAAFPKHKQLSNNRFLSRLQQIPVNAGREANVGLTLEHRRRRWSNIKPTLAIRLEFVE